MHGPISTSEVVSLLFSIGATKRAEARAASIQRTTDRSAAMRAAIQRCRDRRVTLCLRDDCGQDEHPAGA